MEGRASVLSILQSAANILAMQGQGQGQTTSMTMSSMQQITESIEKKRNRLNDPSQKTMSKENILLLATELQGLYKKLLMFDLEGGVSRQIENFMWNDGFKTPLTLFMKSDKNLFHWMIESGVGFYLGLIQDIGIHYDVPFITNSLRGLYCTAPKLKPVWKGVPSKTTVYYIIQNSMVHVGDLLRYRASFIEALKMYEKSAAVCPSNGHPYNQMGLVQLHIDSKSIESLLSGIYYYVRAVSVSNPFLPAQSNLDNLLGKVKAVKPANEQQEFMYDFLRGIGNLDAITMETETYVTLLKSIIPKKLISASQLFRVLVIALFSWKREADKCLLGLESTNREFNALEILAALFNGIVAGMTEATELLASIYLPHLKLAIEWLRYHPHVLNLESFRGKLEILPLCQLVNRLVPLEKTFAATATELGHVILQEEKKLLGFLPLTRAYEHLMSVMGEEDTRGIALRVTRLLKGIEFLSNPKYGFLDRNPFTKEYKEIPRGTVVTSVLRAPSRRNVALQSILNSLEQSQTNNTTTTVSPVPSTSSPKLHMESLGSELSSPVPTQNAFGSTDLNDFSSLFTSIWTPSSRPSSGLASDKTEVDGWN